MNDLLGKSPIIRVLDFEVTGLEDDARIVEVGTCDFNPITHEISRPQSYLCRVPEMPPEVRAIHHIRASDTWDFPPYDRHIVYEQAVRDGVYAWAAHNHRFEERFICGDLPMYCTEKASLRVWPDAPKHNVFSLLYWLEDQGRARFDPGAAHPPHRAGPDAYATAVLLKTMFEEGIKGRDLTEYTRQPRLYQKCPIGQWRGRLWAEVEYGFLDWILRRIDDPDIRFNASLEIERRNHAQ